METTATKVHGIRVGDVSGQRWFKPPPLALDLRIGDVVPEWLPGLGLPFRNEKGEPVPYLARLEREGRHLGPGECVGDALRDFDEVTLHPRINAG